VWRQDLAMFKGVGIHPAANQALALAARPAGSVRHATCGTWRRAACGATPVRAPSVWHRCCARQVSSLSGLEMLVLAAATWRLATTKSLRSAKATRCPRSGSLPRLKEAGRASGYWRTQAKPPQATGRPPQHFDFGLRRGALAAQAGTFDTPSMARRARRRPARHPCHSSRSHPLPYAMMDRKSNDIGRIRIRYESGDKWKSPGMQINLTGGFRKPIRRVYPMSHSFMLDVALARQAVTKVLMRRHSTS
jgi:hypothetical protein